MVKAGHCRKLYKTGDLVKYNPKGMASLIGRKDTQCQVDDRPIETGEIEHQLSLHDLVKQSMIPLPAAGVYVNHLVAIVVLKSTRPSRDGLGLL